MDVREKLEVIAHLGDHITYKEDIGICYDSELAKVIEDAYITLKKGVTVREWISVKDRLPDTEDVFLCWSKVLADMMFCYTSDFQQMEVTHWMPLPQPPKEEK